MRTKQIPVLDWRSSLDALSRSHDGALASLEIVGGEVGAEEEVHDQPMRGITSDPSGVTIWFEKAGGTRIDHRIAHPQKLRLLESSEGAIVALEVEDDAGMRSFLRFSAPARPEAFEHPVD